MRLLLLALILLPQAIFAQSRRPIPYPVLPPDNYLQAIERGTRTASGAPGDSYWTNYARYDIDAVLRPGENLLSGSATIRYFNNSPDPIPDIRVHLRMNMLRPEAMRNWPIAETTSGMVLTEVRAGGSTVGEQPPSAGIGYSIDGTVMQIRLPEPVAPGDSIDLAFAWHFRIPEGAPRLGRDATAYFLGYWYPQIAVYDDLQGWDAQQYRGAGEFYMDFADYDVRIRAPEGWLVPATGVLQNKSEVLTDDVIRRLEMARAGTDVVAVVGPDDRGVGNATPDAADDTLTWHYKAERVRDFAFGASEEYLWDAASAEVADSAGAESSAMVHAFYRPEKTNWADVADYGRFTLEYVSRLMMPYPYPQATAVEGPFPFGGIEFPMITLMGGNPGPTGLFEMTAHEFIHNWWPMIVSSNEKRHMWQDEGLTHLATNMAGATYFDVWDSMNADNLYLRTAGNETPIMRHADSYPSTLDFLISIYPKPKIAYDILGGLYGHDRLMEAVRTYTERWAFKHPTPWDMFRTIEDVLGDDLDWLWSSWFYENWTLDQAVGGVELEDRGVMVRIRDDGLAPMPVPVAVTYADGSVRRRTLPVSAWLAGNREATVLFPSGEVARVEIDPEGFMPDVDRGDNVWTATP